MININVSNVEFVIYDPNYNQFYIFYNSMGKFSTPIDAYHAIVTSTKLYITNSGGIVS